MAKATPLPISYSLTALSGKKMRNSIQNKGYPNKYGTCHVPCTRTGSYPGFPDRSYRALYAKC